jgi:hypothetical protein
VCGFTKRVGRRRRVGVGGTWRVCQLFCKARSRPLRCTARWQNALSQSPCRARHVAELQCASHRPVTHIVTRRLHNTRADGPTNSVPHRFMCCACLHSPHHVAAARTLVHPHQTPGSITLLIRSIRYIAPQVYATPSMQCSIAVASILQSSKLDASRSVST